MRQTPGSRAAFAHRGSGNYDIVLALFCALLLVSNICAVKLISFGPILTDGGAFLFPLTYILGDVLSEVYGFAAAKRAIWVGFGISILASLAFLAVQFAPAAPEWGADRQAAYVTILGFVPRIVIASLCGYVSGQFVNAYVLVKIKERTQENKLWMRLLGSTVAGEAVDTTVFCFIAFWGILTGWAFVQYTVVGYVYKCLVETIFLPITYRVIAWIKRREPSYMLREPDQLTD